MPKCNSCGTQVGYNQEFCPNCGASLKAQPDFIQQQPTSNPADTGGFGWGFLGFCIPIVGLILFLVWKNDRPLTAKAAGIGALIGFIINLITSIIYIAVFAEAIANGGFY